MCHMQMASNLAAYHQSSPVTTKPQAIESFRWSPARLGQTLSAVVRALDEVGEAAEGLLLSHDESMKVFVVFQVHFVICTMVVQSFVNAKQVTSTCSWFIFPTATGTIVLLEDIFADSDTKWEGIGLLISQLRIDGLIYTKPQSFRVASSHKVFAE